MKKLFLILKTKEVLLSTIIVALIITSSFLAYSNRKLNKEIVSLQGTVQGAAASSSYMYNRGIHTLNESGIVPVISMLPYGSATTSTLTNSSAGDAYREAYLKLREDAIGCYFGESNINERVSLNRSMGYVLYKEGAVSYMPTYGSYEVRDDKPIITLIPQDSSKILLDIDNTKDIVTLKNKNGMVYKKGECVDFYF